MPEAFAVRLHEVTKTYRLFGSQREQLIDALGLSRFAGRRSVNLFTALNNVSVDVARGHRIGIIGRNGAGKTTLLKLICGNFAPSSGTVEVKGTVQALLGMGLGFHQDYTGRENIVASLQYNGLSRAEYDGAIAEIIDFCELGPYIDQPIKTYSLGMQARLMFAAATAIRPDILIVDEILGAGDAYFVAKSKVRVERLVATGCTMLLVSHSMQQVLELCNEVIWLDQGAIRMRGEAFLVVKAYEEFMHGPILRAQAGDTARLIPASPPAAASPPATAIEVAIPAAQVTGIAPAPARLAPSVSRLQEPRFLPHAEPASLPPLENEETSARTLAFIAPGGVSRWHGDPGLKVCGLTIITEQGETNTIAALRPAKIVFWLEVETASEHAVRYGVALHDLKGRCATRIFSPIDRFSGEVGDLRRIEILLNPAQIGPGEYTLGISVIGETAIEQVNAAQRYDLLSRSFLVKVTLADSLGAVAADYFQSAEWQACPVTARITVGTS